MQARPLVAMMAIVKTLNLNDRETQPDGLGRSLDWIVLRTYGADLMDATELLKELEKLDIVPWEKEGRLRLRAPRGSLTDDLRRCIDKHKEELVEILRSESSSPESEPAPPADPRPREGQVGQHRAPCPTCGDTWCWPTVSDETGEHDWACATCLVSHSQPIRFMPEGGGEPITVAPDGEPPMPEPAAKSRWLVERDLDPESVKAALDTCLATEWGGVMPDVPQGRLLSRLNTWLEGQGRRPTTWPVMRAALGVEDLIKPRRAVIAPCPRCGGTDWGDSGRREADGAAVWQCRTCPCPLSHAGRAEA